MTPQGDQVDVDVRVRRQVLRARRRQGRRRRAVGRQRPLRPAHPGLHGGSASWPTTPSIRLAAPPYPVELDRIFSSLDDLVVALGPKGANKNGALSRPARRRRRQPGGRGRASINGTLTDLSKALATLSGGRDDLFGTVKNLQAFTTTLATNDGQVRAFNTDLASVADQLAASATTSRWP